MPRFTYRHRCRPGAMHCATYYDSEKYRRLMHRTTFGERRIQSRWPLASAETEWDYVVALTEAGSSETDRVHQGIRALMNWIFADEGVVFADALNRTHAARPVCCWAPKDVPIVVEQRSGRDCLNIHGAIDLETRQTHHEGCLVPPRAVTMIVSSICETSSTTNPPRLREATRNLAGIALLPFGEQSHAPRKLHRD